MGLDVIVGRVVNHPGYYGEDDIRIPDEVIDAANRSGDDIDDSVYITVDACPDADFDVVPRHDDPWNYRRAYFRGWEFFEALPMYERMRFYPGSNDTDIAFLAPVLGEILALPDHNEDVYYWDAQMVRFKYWCKVAVEMYGNKAAIKFC